ncbi:hypothetical protein CBS63078_4548 [Aspergillus niger]|uniref:EamA domain-containing protein n=1 Tax=Aspergillus niger ATCC 13496 TaxID=1353008 RepID=A0A370C6M3_ASPNG|nr:hypothetical protein ANI_1_1624074 [Aspergillus niger CBS 513.88]KAI2815893.1 hypothetical protein CBS115989_7306 [Aspergillus niger]RDH23488.1 hypothetical protein M747DRAFT_293307 [Aspergillus niger ATCC 13496]KAI2857933.1 hypothetical protein CBS11232_2945 [Aspergillus niger]KAI2874358.1 hypothetical protein CBS115988_6280 [Aspergillus niger]KAI2887535.1 hypothetical protein CBS13152_6716 [Aspergillus niger]|eukprot:XP_001392204.2 hypothetical protein ANI_1_1624074 [Aspergillus niger CBS 513.88]
MSLNPSDARGVNSTAGEETQQYVTLLPAQNQVDEQHQQHVVYSEQTPLLRSGLGHESASASSAMHHYSSQPWWKTAQQVACDVWLQGKGMILVMFSQFFGASMNVMTQFLEIKGRDGKGFHPFQILFARMSITVLASYLYMWYARVPHPFGTRDTFTLLMLRAGGGFFGVYGLYYSVQYLPLSEATVVTFLAPILSCYACSLLIPNEFFTRKQQLAGLVSLAGVVLIARPFPFMRSGGDSEPEQGDKPGATDSYHHVLAIVVALFGVLGASCAYTTIRMIGQRCHPLVSVTYFSTFTTVVATLAMLVVPSIPLELPGTVLEWTLLLGLGVSGFLLQFLLTAGLAYVPPVRKTKASVDWNRDYGTRDEEEEPSAKPTSSGSRATFMLYTQMLFAVFYDRAIWGSTLSAVSWMGSVLILVSAMYVAMAREGAKGTSSEEKEGGDQEGTDENRAGVAAEERLEEGGGRQVSGGRA